MSTLDKIKLRYVGTRFDGARLPVDVLSDLPAFRDLVVAFARARWLEENPKRQRLPAGFERSIHFDLIAVEEGSAMPCLRWEIDETQSAADKFGAMMRDHVGQSVDAIAALWDNADRGDYPKSLSPAEIAALDKFGSSLHDGERIEIPSQIGKTGNVVYLDAAKRREIITRIKPTYNRSIEGIGRLVANLENGYIRVQTPMFGEISIQVGEAEVKASYDGHLSEQVSFSLLVELDHQDRFRNVVTVNKIELIDEGFRFEIETCKLRLQEINALSVGWNNGVGNSVTGQALFGAQKFLDLKPSYSRSFRIFPTEAGGVLFEFETGGWDLSVEIGHDGSAEFYGIEISGPGEIEPIKFDAIDDAFLATVNSRLGAHA